jgi:hypothetical protein
MLEHKNDKEWDFIQLGWYRGSKTFVPLGEVYFFIPKSFYRKWQQNIVKIFGRSKNE